MSTDSKIEVSTELLRKLHRIHRQLTDLRSQVDRAPIQIRVSTARVTKNEEAVAEIQEQVKQAKLVADRKQLQLAEREARIKDLEAKLNTAASNREFATLQEQIAADKQANDVLSDEVLEVLEQIDELTVGLDEATSLLENESKDHEKRVSEINSRLEIVTDDLAEVETDLTKTETAIPSEIRADYDRIVKAKGEDALAPVEEDSCACCCQTLTTQVLDRLRMSILVRCPSCHAFLYLPEDLRVR